MLGAIWISEEVLGMAERLARLTERSRSQLCQDAIEEYVLRHVEDLGEENRATARGHGDHRFRK
jgi:hypothetical protein